MRRAPPRRLPIFLFNYNDRYLHGVFRATSYGELEINPHGALPPHLPTPAPSVASLQLHVCCLPREERRLAAGSPAG